MRYNARLDDTSKIVTHLCIVLTLLMSCRQITDISHDAIATTMLLFVLVPAIVVAWCLSPRYYKIEAGAILIKRPLMSITIPMTDIVRLKSITEEELGSGSRMAGMGGLFGYLGTYHSSEIGKYQRWCTNKDSMVLIESSYRKWLISPSNAEHFIRYVNSIINVPG
ncbi:MAG TPA: PH domain-containing protein [Chitinophaga sp.]|uniref:PH domain-containing protein n=1 Tax=Chitinophaga sp. TaxID=1869181 RepID=UPI002CF654FC|nr:PH domain-containing protein [Chitinophaga sp.]HVI47668.1 PH domain-containing protein [Chitinophaga sp.]